MNCPRCRTSELTAAILRDYQSSIPTYSCTQCEGSWLSADAMVSIEQIAEPTMWETRDLLPEQIQLAGLYCPSCVEHPLLNKEEHRRDHHVIIDRCTQCGGVWLDAGEIQSIQKENWLTTILNIIRN